ncbi:MAG: histidine kinase [Nocardiaceae bacterium]|nr:histidine kinase [Nocardiaceae bacterium]
MARSVEIRDVMSRLESWAGADSDWERIPQDLNRVRRTDSIIALIFAVVGILGIELMRSIDMLSGISYPGWVPHFAVITAAIPLALRRVYPLTIAGLLSLHMLVTGLSMPAVMSSMPLQVLYFFALFTGVAWARDRRAMVIVVGLVLVVMFGWIAWQFAVGSGIEDILSHNGKAIPRQGLFAPIAAFITYTVLVNIVYFGGAVLGGQAAWRAAQQRARLVEQAETIERQSEDLQRQAVVEERLRIARELHDVVAHHVSVIGVQASAAQRMLRRDPDIAETSLRSIETSSRDAVTQMRGLLGTLRSADPVDANDRAPEPNLLDVRGLVEEVRDTGLDVTLDIVEDQPSALLAVSGPVGLSLYRTVQEALANVRRHSTATKAHVSVRVSHAPQPRFAHGYAEVEVIDDGRPRQGTSGSGLGLLGVRERLSTHGGVSEIGPRVTGGYRVRVRLPLGETK